MKLCKTVNVIWESGSAQITNVLEFVLSGEIRIFKHLTLDITTSKEHVNIFYPKAHLRVMNRS